MKEQVCKIMFELIVQALQWPLTCMFHHAEVHGDAWVLLTDGQSGAVHLLAESHEAYVAL